MYIVRDKLNTYLYSPYRWDDGDECWIWGTNPSRAHHFKSRKEAKDTLERIDPKYVMSSFNFEKAR